MNVTPPMCAHMARRHDEAKTAADAAGYVLLTERFGELVDGLDAVLQRHDECLGAEQRTQRLHGLGHLPRLDAEQHDVNGTDVGRAGARDRGLDVHVAEHAVDA